MTFLKIVSGVRKYLPIILSGVSVAGSVATPILAVKASEKLPENPTAKEVLETYKWTILSELVTVGSIIGGTAISWTRANELTKVAETASRNLAIVSGSATAGLGISNMKKKTMEDLKNLPEKNSDSPVELWYDVQFDYFFEAKETDILWAMYYTLGYFAEHGDVLLENFYQSAGARPPENIRGVGWYVDDHWLEDWEDYTVSFSYDNEPVEDQYGQKYRRLIYEKPPKFYEELFY